VSTKFFFFKKRDTRFLFNFVSEQKCGRRRNFGKSYDKENNWKVDPRRKIKKTVSSTVFDRGFPWNVGQMPRQGLEVSFLLEEFP